MLERYGMNLLAEVMQRLLLREFFQQKGLVSICFPVGI